MAFNAVERQGMESQEFCGGQFGGQLPLGKLIRTLESLANDPRLNAQANMEKAIIEWREDMDWVKQNLRVAAP